MGLEMKCEDPLKGTFLCRIMGNNSLSWISEETAEESSKGEQEREKGRATKSSVSGSAVTSPNTAKCHLSTGSLG